MIFSENEIKQIKERGSDVDQVKEQIENFVNGFPHINALRAAAEGDGILRFDQSEVARYVKLYQDKSKAKHIVKFVPASGAASRMFKELFAFLDDNQLEGNQAVQTFIDGLSNFAFYKELAQRLEAKGMAMRDVLAEKRYQVIIQELLSADGMDYGSLPKGLLLFHKYENEIRTPAAEHFAEGAAYAVGKGNVVNIHFTVSPNHQQKFEQHVAAIKPHFEALTGVQFEVSFSQQKKSTDTIAVDMENQPFVEEDGTLLFRPAGHGALLANLNDLDTDMVFVKNIDNVVPDKLKKPTIEYKQVIGGLLIELQEKKFALTERLQQGDQGAIGEAAAYLSDKINLKLPTNYETMTTEDKKAYLLSKLDRPIRVCGMVKNTGEPGGGPFWVKDKDGTEAIQIAETAQIDLDNPEQAAMLKNSTHFSPTDLVCGIKNHEGEKYDLMKHRDPQTGFITNKSKNGRNLKAQELPGLWNGSMADWNSVMVEVPLETFNPVKTVNDLLKPAHQ